MSQQQPDPAEAGKNVEDPSPEQTTDETADDDSVYDRFFVHHNGGNRFTVHDDESQKTYRIDLDKVGTSDVLECIDAGPSGSHDVPQTDRAYILAAAIRAGPEYRPGPQEQLTVQVASPQGNGQSGTTSSSGSDESATSPSEVLSSPGSDHEYDPDELTENVDEWLSNYSNVKGDLVDGWWDLSFQKLTDPSNGSSDLGIHIELEPFGHSCWDGDSWSSDDAKDEWKDHQAAMRDVFQSDDNPITSFSVETDDEYDDYYNYVPAEDAQELP